jgi:CBS domain-containing protein
VQLREIMSHPVRTVRAGATVQHAAEMMALHDVGALAVCEDDVLVGMVTDRDIVLRCLARGRAPGTTEVQRIMTENPLTLPPSATAEQAARIFRDVRIRRLPVVDERHPVGMVTVDDLARLWDNEAGIVLLARRVAPRNKASAARA